MLSLLFHAIFESMIRNPERLALFSQYAILALFGFQGLASRPPFTPSWWLMLALLLAFAGLVTFWPRKRAFRIPYLVVETALLLALTYLDVNFMFLGFLVGPVAFLLLPLFPAVLYIASILLAVGALMVTRYGWSGDLFSLLTLLVGILSFGYAVDSSERANAAREKAERLLKELSEANDKLSKYAAQVQDLAALEERNRLARELHDSVKQQAFAASGQLGAARSLLASSPDAARDHLVKAEALMDEVRRELNQIIYEMRPAALQNQSLAGALRTWGAGWAEQAGIALEVRVQGERSLPQETEQSLFRIAQEALSNIARHSQARHAELSLEYCGEGISLLISDDGLGFDPAAEAAGIGLRSMQERAQRLTGGSLKVTSAPGQGTRVTVTCAG